MAMRITFVHDAKGTIRSAGYAVAEATRQAQLVADGDQRISEIDTSAAKDVEELQPLANRKRAAEQSAAWRELTRRFRIDAKGNLLRK